jgi:putative SOS response-associated peptidase YedK
VCGRFVSTNSPERISAYFGASFEAEPLGENFNVAPTNDVLAVVAGGDGPAVRAFHWGLVPTWAKDAKIGSKMINARAETVAEKPAFKGLFAKHRLIVPMDGFYEWQAIAGQKTKQPMFIHRRDGEPLAVAGLWTTWRDRTLGDDAPWLHSLTLITTSANATMAPVHDRMPVLLPASRWEEWLDPANRDVEQLQRLLVPAPDDLLELRRVSTAVNNVRNKGPELIEPDRGEGEGQLAI